MMSRVIIKTSFGNVPIGDGLPVHLIAEIGLNHNGSVILAKEMIHAAAISGATIVKFQKRFPDSLATKDFLDKPFEKAPMLGSTQREVRERLELNFNEYKELKEYAESLGLIFCATAFDVESLDFLMRLEVPLIKVASHSVTNLELLEKIVEYDVPTICSFGGTTEEERDIAFNILKNNPLIIMHCVSAYPTPDNLAKIDTISYYRKKYKVPIGFSSHEVGIDISFAAAVVGATIIERHFTLNRAMIGLDQTISLQPEEFAELSLKLKRLQNIRGITIGIAEEEKQAKYNYHTAVCSRRKIKKGEKIRRKDLTCKQPLENPDVYFSGLELYDVVGKVALVNINEDERIKREYVK